MPVMYDGGQTAHPTGDHRRAAGHGFQGDQPETLVVRRHDAHIGGIVIQGQVVVIDPSHEFNQVVYLAFFSQTAHPVGFGFAGAPAAHYHHADVFFAGLHLRGGFHQEVQALQRLHPAHVQQHFLTVEAQAPADFLLVQGAELGQVDSARRQHHARRVGAVQTGHGIALMSAEGNNAVGGEHCLPLHRRPLFRLDLPRPRLHLNQGQGVEGDHVGNAQAAGKTLAYPRRKPVMGMRHAIGMPFPFPKGMHFLQKSGEIGI